MLVIGAKNVLKNVKNVKYCPGSERKKKYSKRFLSKWECQKFEKMLLVTGVYLFEIRKMLLTKFVRSWLLRI